MGDFSKLPKFARDRIAVLTRDLAYANAKLAEGPENNLAWAEPFSDAPRPLGDQPHVRIQVPRPEHHLSTGDQDSRFNIDVRLLEDGTVEVHGSHNLSVMPRSSNVVRLRLVKS